MSTIGIENWRIIVYVKMGFMKISILVNVFSVNIRVKIVMVYIIVLIVRVWIIERKGT